MWSAGGGDCGWAEVGSQPTAIRMEIIFIFAHE